MEDLIPAERIESKIYLVRGRKVILDKDLAQLYGVKTKTLIQAVKRNLFAFLMPLPSRGLPCFPQFFEVKERFKLIFKL